MNSSNANNTLIDEMMQLLIAEKEKAFPTILAKLYNQAMIVERETHLGAGSYERSEGRDGYANGFKPRNYQTFHGNLSLQVPQVRFGIFPSHDRDELGTDLGIVLTIT